MIPYTTPTLAVTVDGEVDFSQASEIYVTISQAQTAVTKTLEDGVDVDIDGKTLLVYLTQEESKRFNQGKAELQANWIYTDAITQETKRAAIEAITVDIGKQLYKRVIE